MAEDYGQQAPATDQSEDKPEAESNVLKDRWGNERPWDPEKYPDHSAAKEGHITPPSGQGGATPKSRPDHQDMFPANPPPSRSAEEKGREDEKVMRGEVSPVNPDGTGADDEDRASSPYYAATSGAAAKTKPASSSTPASSSGRRSSGKPDEK